MSSKRYKKMVNPKMVYAGIAIVVVLLLIVVFVLGSASKPKVEEPVPNKVGFYQLVDGSVCFYGDEQYTLIVNKDSDFAYLSSERVKKDICWEYDFDYIIFESFPETLGGLENVVTENTKGIYVSPKAPQNIFDAYGERVIKLKSGEKFVCSNIFFTVKKTHDDSLSLVAKHGKEYFVFSEVKLNVNLSEEEEVLYAMMPMDEFAKTNLNVTTLCYRGQVGDTLQIQEKVVEYFGKGDLELPKIANINGEGMYMLVDFIR